MPAFLFLVPVRQTVRLRGAQLGVGVYLRFTRVRPKVVFPLL